MKFYSIVYTFLFSFIDLRNSISLFIFCIKSLNIFLTFPEMFFYVYMSFTLYVLSILVISLWLEHFWKIMEGEILKITDKQPYVKYFENK